MATRLSRRAQKLRKDLLGLLKKQGFKLGPNLFLKQTSHGKDEVRQIHSLSRRERLSEERAFVEANLPQVWKYFASGRDLDPNKIQPYPVLVEDDEELGALFRIASLWWSVPVSRGFGRRFRVVVLDRSNAKLIGLLGLTDPVFNLRVRDSWIGWTADDREERLAHVMDAYVLGAVPPYNRLLGAKLIALLAASDFIREVFQHRYRAVRSIIRRKQFDGRLAMITATGALGRSSIYNRLRLSGIEVFRPVGLTEGYGHFHLANGTYEKLREYLRAEGEDEVDRYEFGRGPNYRFRVVRKALEYLELPADLLRHGVRRAVYLAPLASNATKFLKGEATRLRWHKRPLDEVIQLWRERWLIPRAERDTSYASFDRDTWRQILELPTNPDGTSHSVSPGILAEGHSNQLGN